MNTHMLRFSGPELTRLRNLIAEVGKEIHLVRAGDTAQPGGTKTALDTTWSRLVDMLDLGPEPEMCDCPTCKRPSLLGATRCGSCWSSLPALKGKEKLVA